MTTWAERYTSAAFAAREEERLWPNAWLVAGRATHCAHAGERLLFDLGAHTQVIVVRGEDGVLRAFHNVCVHRGTRLCMDEAPQAKLACPYHGWTYGLDGRILAAPGCARPWPDGLAAVRCEERHGLAWIALSDRPPPLAKWLGALDAELAELGLDAWGTSSDVSVELACNWKASSDAQIETVHVSSLHAQIAGAFDTDRAKVTRVAPHARVVVQPKVREYCEIRLFCLFPNAQLNVSPGEATLLRHRPHASGDAARSVFDQIVLARGRSEARQPHRFVAHEDPAIGPVFSADLRIAERVQRGLATGVFGAPRLGPGEAAIGWMHEEIDRLLSTAT
jgi:choline monooxygenase